MEKYMKRLSTILSTGLFCAALLAMSPTQAGNSDSPKTIPVGLQAVKNYIPNAIFCSCTYIFDR